MRRAALAMLGVLLAVSVVSADDKPSYHVVVDRVDHEPASITGTRLQVEFSALTLQGQLIDLSDAKSFKAYLGNSEIKTPFSFGTFAGTKGPVAIAFVVQTTADYKGVLPAIADTLDTSLLAALDENVTQVAILPFSTEANTNGKLTSIKQARTKIGALSTDGVKGEPAMLATVERALALLKRATTEPEGQPIRKIIVVIGDGRDRDDDKDRVTRLGLRANKEGVRIHTFAYSAAGTRRPMLALGELSKRSSGTFRWVQRDKADSWAPAMEQLRDEILKQNVLTFFLGPDDDPSGKKVRIELVGRVVATSNALKVNEAACRGEVCAGYCAGSVCAVPKPEAGRGILGWILLIGGIAIGAILLLAVISWVLSKRSPSIPLPPGAVMPVKAKKGKQPQPVPGHLQMPVPAAAAAPTGPGPHLLIVTGPRTGERLALKNGFQIGKQVGSDLLIDDGFTSGHHAQIVMDQFGSVRIYDQNSTNGTFVNGVRVSECVLENGVSMRIGSTEILFLAQ